MSDPEVLAAKKPDPPATEEGRGGPQCLRCDDLGYLMDLTSLKTAPCPDCQQDDEP